MGILLEEEKGSDRVGAEETNSVLRGLYQSHTSVLLIRCTAEEYFDYSDSTCTFMRLDDDECLGWFPEEQGLR